MQLKKGAVSTDKEKDSQVWQSCCFQVPNWTGR